MKSNYSPSILYLHYINEKPILNKKSVIKKSREQRVEKTSTKKSFQKNGELFMSFYTRWAWHTAAVQLLMQLIGLFCEKERFFHIVMWVATAAHTQGALLAALFLMGTFIHYFLHNALALHWKYKYTKFKRVCYF